jgi:uncharacterized membrane protein
MRVEMEIDPRKFIGPSLLLVGWIVLILAVVFLTSTGGRFVLILLGLLIELIGLGFFVRHRSNRTGARA